MTHLNKFQMAILLILISVVLFPASAMAHVRWLIGSVTPPRSNDTGLKINPCGGKARTTRSTIFSGGQTIDVQFEETVNHPGHYRIAFSPADDLNFDSYVLVDNIPDVTQTGLYTQQITIPTQVCSACTLQLIQVMTTNPNPLPGDYYYSCSDIQITNPGDTTPPLAVNGVQAQEGDSQVSLNWTNPTDDFYQVVLLKDTSPILETPTDGVMYSAGDTINGIQVAYAGNGSSYTATTLNNDTAYYFKVFAQNPRKNYASGVEASATPIASATGGGGDTGNSGNNGGSGDSGGGGIQILFWTFLLMIRRFASRHQHNPS